MSTCDHTSQNSYWVYDAKGIPLCRVCPKCKKAKLAGYRPSVLTADQQKLVFGKVVAESPYDWVEEPMDEDG